jgi:hypothetical protein
MKKALLIAVCLFAMVGLLFANQIIPSGVQVAGAEYPFPTSAPPTVMPPDGPGDIFYWTDAVHGYSHGPLGAMVAECALCVVNFDEDVYKTFVVKFTVWDTELGWVQRYGTYAGREVISNRAVYEWVIPLGLQYLDGCIVIGPPQSAQLYLGSVPIAVTLTYLGGSPRVCGMTLPLIIK